MPVCIGLRKDQIEKLEQLSKKSRGPKAGIIYFAIERYKHGDITIPEHDPMDKDIVPFTVWKKLGYEDWQIRAMLDASFEKKPKIFDGQIGDLDKQISGMFQIFGAKECLFEDPEELARYERFKAEEERRKNESGKNKNS